VKEVARNAGEPDFFHFSAEACNVRAFSRQENFAWGSGASVQRDYALAKAVGESVERYCSALFRIEDLPLTTYEQATFPCTVPENFALFGENQYNSEGFPYLPFRRDTPVRWFPGLDAATGQIQYVPAAFIYVPYYFYQGTGDAPITQPISTGLACQASTTEAAISAISEVIERDAFTITWQAMLASPHILLESLSPANRDLVARFEKAGYSIYLLDITTDVSVPTFLAVLRGDYPDTVPLVVAAATSIDPEVAARKALEEVELTRSYFLRIIKEKARLEPDPTFSNVISQESHLNYWCDWAHLPFADFLTSCKETIEFGAIQNLATGQPRKDLALLIGKVTAIGHQVLLADLTTPDVREVGLAVVRAVIPGFHPLVAGHRFRALGGSRLWTVPQKLGYSGITPEGGDNPYPHPYP
jgi:ribosomal protein S12 methylthiotransferase accessory factor